MTTAVILAGGKSRRMGRDKLSLPQGDTTVLASAVSRFSEKFDRVLLSVDTPGRYPEIAVRHICDIFPDCGPLGGLHAALTALDGKADGVFLAAADLPFSDPAAALRLMSLRGEHEICILRDESGRFEPLFGFYGGGLLGRVTELLENGRRAMTELYDISDTLILRASDIGIAASGQMLANMNRPEDFYALLGGK